MALGETDAGLAHFTEATRLHPAFPNAWHGKALAELRAGHPATADATLRHFFAQARAADSRSRHVFAEARRLFLDVQTTLATTQESDAFKSTHALRAEVETLSGHAVEFTSEKLSPGIAAQAQIAWKHGRPRHRISLRVEAPPPPATCASPSVSRADPHPARG